MTSQLQCSQYLLLCQNAEDKFNHAKETEGTLELYWSSVFLMQIFNVMHMVLPSL